MVDFPRFSIVMWVFGEGNPLLPNIPTTLYQRFLILIGHGSFLSSPHAHWWRMVSAQPNRGELGGKIVSSDVRKFGKLLPAPLWRFSSFANFWWHIYIYIYIYVKLPFTPEQISSKLTWDISRNWRLEAGDLKKHSHFSLFSFTFSTQMMLLTSEPSVSRFSRGFKTSFQGFFWIL